MHSGKTSEQEFGERVNGHYRDILGLLESIFVQGREAGFFRPNLDAPSAATTLLALIEGHIYLTILEDRMPLERLLLPILAAVKASWAADEEAEEP